MPAAAFKARKELFEKAGIEFRGAGALVDEVWGEARPPMP
jgi:hypothetical protein